MRGDVRKFFSFGMVTGRKGNVDEKLVISFRKLRDIFQC